MTTIWNDAPPASPPTTDADPCVEWAGQGVSGHDHPHGHQPGGQQAPMPYPAPPSTHGEPHGGAPDPTNWSGAPTPPPLPPKAPSSRPGRGGRARVALIAAAVAGLVGSGFVARGLVDQPTASTPPASVAATNAASTVSPDTPLLNGADEEPVAAVAKALGPSVVVIRTGDGLGSGVVYDDAGLILTNAHVVGTATDVKVTLDGGQIIDGSVLGADPVTDVAVVRVTDTANLKAARLADEAPEVGDLTVALGSPFGLERTVTAGVVSAVDRPVDNQAGGFVNMIQTDAPINPGNSGGALANRRAEIIGINSMIYSQSGDNAGIGFSIPIARAKAIADRLANGEQIEHAALGIGLAETTDGQPGAMVRSVTAGSAAERAGLVRGDVVTEVDGKALKSADELAGAIGAKNAGDTIELTVERNGSTATITATLDAKAPSTPPTTQR